MYGNIADVLYRKTAMNCTERNQAFFCLMIYCRKVFYQPYNLGIDTLRAGNTAQIQKWDLHGWKLSSINKNKSFEGMLEKVQQQQE